MYDVRPQPRQSPKKHCDPMKAKVNVAGHSVRTIQRHIQATAFTSDTNVQVAALNKIRDCNRNGHWLIKADPCDMRRGLRESMRHKWAGDSDLGDGKLEALYQEYTNRRGFFSVLGIKEQRQQLEADLKLVISGLDVDLKMLEDVEKQANEKYANKQRQSNVSKDSLFALPWECEGYKTLLNMNKELKSSMTSLQREIQGVAILLVIYLTCKKGFFSMSSHCAPRREMQPRTLQFS